MNDEHLQKMQIIAKSLYNETLFRDLATYTEVQLYIYLVLVFGGSAGFIVEDEPFSTEEYINYGFLEHCSSN